jgi:release factor glutamine methyltransferase
VITLVGKRTGPVLRATSERLRTACIATAQQDAELLLARVTGTSRLELHLEPERLVDRAALDHLEALVRRRVCHEPLQYILGETEFHGLRVAVGPGVFIPRPETELLVERALAVSGDAARTAVDLCTGSGAVACALAAGRPALAVWAVELSPDAAAWARRNVSRLGLGDRVRVLEGDLVAALEGRGLERRCDLVVGNPPYIPRPALGGLPAEVRAFEPELALDGGPDGLVTIARILREAPRFLRADGRVLLEVGEGHAAPLREALATDPRYDTPRFYRDLLGDERILEVGVR